MRYWAISKFAGPIDFDTEWTAASDVGREFAGRVLTWAEYEEVEGRYVRAFERACRALGVTELTIDGPWAGEPLPDWFPPFRDGVRVDAGRAARMVPAVLRGEVWCAFRGPGGLCVTFGDDLELYVRGPDALEKARDDITALGLYVLDLDLPDPELFDGDPETAFTEPADAAFWDRADAIRPPEDRALLVRETWARGPYGDRRWYAPAPGAVRAVAAEVASGAVITVFPAIRLFAPDAPDLPTETPLVAVRAVPGTSRLEWAPYPSAAALQSAVARGARHDHAFAAPDDAPDGDDRLSGVA